MILADYGLALGWFLGLPRFSLGLWGHNLVKRGSSCCARTSAIWILLLLVLSSYTYLLLLCLVSPELHSQPGSFVSFSTSCCLRLPLSAASQAFLPPLPFFHLPPPGPYLLELGSVFGRSLPPSTPSASHS